MIKRRKWRCKNACKCALSTLLKKVTHTVPEIISHTVPEIIRHTLHQSCQTVSERSPIIDPIGSGGYTLHVQNCSFQKLVGRWVSFSPVVMVEG